MSTKKYTYEDLKSWQEVAIPTPEVTEKNIDKMPEIKDEAEKKEKDAQVEVLKGTLELRPSEKTIRIKPADVIKVEGVGKVLGGKYHVDEVRWVLDRSGISISIEVTKVGFNDGRDLNKLPRHVATAVGLGTYQGPPMVYDQPIGPEPNWTDYGEAIGPQQLPEGGGTR